MNYDLTLEKPLKVMDIIINSDEKYNVFYPAQKNDCIGDFVICAGLCGEISRKKGKKIAFFCKSGLRRFGFIYDEIDFYWINNETVDFLVTIIDEKNDIDYSGDNYLYLWFPKDDKGERIRNYSYNFAEEYKVNLFNLHRDTKVVSPKFIELTENKKNQIIRKYQLDKAKTIIICPYDGSFTKSSSEFLKRNFWVDLVDSLKKKGFVIYTNVYGKSQEAIKGTLPIEYQGNEIPLIADNINSFIGVRSGFMDLLALLGARVLCVTNVGTFNYDLKKMFPNSNSYTYFLAERYWNTLHEHIKIDTFEQQIIDSLNIKLTYEISIDTSKNIGSCLCLSLKNMIEKISLDILKF